MNKSTSGPESTAPSGASEFELDDEALPAFLERIVDDYGTSLEDFDCFEGLANAGLAHLVEEAAQAGVIRSADGFAATAIQLSPVAGCGTYVLVMLALGRSGLHISAWPSEFDDRPEPFAGPQAPERLQDCLEDVLVDANLLLRQARKLMPPGRL
jgi:hypothetical protein